MPDRYLTFVKFYLMSGCTYVGSFNAYFQLILALTTFVLLQLCRLQGKSQIVEDELVRLGEQMVHSAEGTRAIALELCREFEDKFLQHIATGEVSIFLLWE